MTIKNNLKRLFYSIIALIIFVAVWFIAALIVNREYILPTPNAALKSFFGLIITPQFYVAVWATLLRSLISFAAAFVFALLFAVLSVLFKKVDMMLSPMVSILRSTPTISIILLALIWLKSYVAPMLVAFLIVFPTLYAAIYGAIKTVDKELLQMSKIYKVASYNIVTKLYIPSVLPAVFTSAKSNISLNLKIIIASEVLAATRVSMGYQMQLSKLYLETPLLLAWTIAAVLLGFLLETAVDIIKNKVIRWQI